MFKRISGLFKEATVVIIIFSLSRQLIYYTSFHVPIKYFFTFSEIWLSLANDLFILLPYSLLMLAGYEAIITKTKIPITDIPNEVNQDKIQVILVKKNASYLNKIFKWLFITLLIILTLTSVYYWVTTPDFEMRVLFCLMTLLAVYIFITSTFQNDKGPTDSHFIAFCLFMLFFLLTIMTTFDVRRAKKGLYKGTTIVTKDSVYRSTDSSFFIGKTENYTFIHNLKDSSTEIIPTESIIKFSIKMK